MVTLHDGPGSAMMEALPAALGWRWFWQRCASNQWRQLPAKATSVAEAMAEAGRGWKGRRWRRRQPEMPERPEMPEMPDQQEKRERREVWPIGQRCASGVTCES